MSDTEHEREEWDKSIACYIGDHDRCTLAGCPCSCHED